MQKQEAVFDPMQNLDDLESPLAAIQPGSDLEVEERLEKVLDVLEMPKRKWGMLDCRVFDGLWPLVMWDVDFRNGSKEERLEIASDLPPHFMDITDAKVMASIGDSDSGERKDYGVILSRIQGVNWHDVRGRLRMVLPHTVRYSIVPVVRNRSTGTTTVWQDEIILGYRKGHWVRIGTDCKKGSIGIIDKEIDDKMQVAMGISVLLDQIWRVYFAQGPVGVTFPTDAVGAAAAFRLRDIPEGKKRRDALKHWVREHFRRKRTDHNELVKVCEHLRGADRFTWNGLRCRILPSRIDLERVAAARKRQPKTLTDRQLVNLSRRALGPLPKDPRKGRMNARLVFNRLIEKVRGLVMARGA